MISVNIGNSVTSIRNFAFNCSNLTSVSVGMKTPIAIDYNTFTNRKNATLSVPRGSKAAYEAANYWKEFKKIEEIEDSNQPKGDVNGDQTVDVADMATVIDMMATGTDDTSADLNGDGKVDVADIITLINEMAARARRQNEAEE